MTMQFQAAPDKLFFGDKAPAKFDFANAPSVSVASVEELYAAVNDPANANTQILLAPGVYMLSATDSGGASARRAARTAGKYAFARRGGKSRRGRH